MMPSSLSSQHALVMVVAALLFASSCATSTESVNPTASIDGLAAIATIDGMIEDDSRQRVIRYRLYAPIDLAGPLPVVLVSHGGQGSVRAHRLGGHIGETLAGRQYVAIHVGHEPSGPDSSQVTDRPADISFVLDRLEEGDIDFPDGFIGTVDMTRVGHTGHSFGAYTSHAVAGATFLHGTYGDDRIDAIAPISPQGPNGPLGGFDNGGADHTWATVEVPAYNIVGELEIDVNAVGTVDEPGWRLTPFRRYDDTADRLLSVIEGQDHRDMYDNGSDEVKAFIAVELADFFDVYLAGDRPVDPCTIGVSETVSVVVETQRSAASSNSRIAGCG